MLHLIKDSIINVFSLIIYNLFPSIDKFINSIIVKFFWFWVEELTNGIFNLFRRCKSCFFQMIL